MSEVFDAANDDRLSLLWEQRRTVIAWIARILHDRTSMEECPEHLPYCAPSLRALADSIDDAEPTIARSVPEREIAGKKIPAHIIVVDGHRRAYVRKALGLPVLVILD